MRVAYLDNNLVIASRETGAISKNPFKVGPCYKTPNLGSGLSALCDAFPLNLYISGGRPRRVPDGLPHVAVGI